MRDDRGVYYYPVLEQKNLRMYVRPVEEDVEFRLYDSDNSETWEHHQWLPWSAIQQAAELYRKEKQGKAPPLHLYDIEVAVRLIRDELRNVDIEGQAV